MFKEFHILKDSCEVAKYTYIIYRTLFYSTTPITQSAWQLGYGIGYPGFEFWQREEIYLLSERTISALSPPNLIFDGYWSSCPGLKRPEHFVHLPPCSAEGKSEWSCMPSWPQQE